MVVQKKIHLNIQNNWLGVESYRFRSVQQFKYLGIVRTQQNDVYSKVRKTIKVGDKCYFGLIKLLQSRILSTNLKIQIHRSLIKLAVTYRSGTWTLESQTTKMH
jgi:hypothetical protein